MDYGLDEYSRYVEDDKGERFAIEPYPLWNRWALWYKLTARWWILRWHVGMIRQYGISIWWEERKY